MVRIICVVVTCLLPLAPNLHALRLQSAAAQPNLKLDQNEEAPINLKDHAEELEYEADMVMSPELLQKYEGAMTQLWNGEDVSLASMKEFELKQKTTGNAIQLPQGTKLEILGGFDSGTNLLVHLLTANVGNAQMNKICPGAPSGPVEGPGGRDAGCHVWKHSAPQSLKLDTNKTTVIAVVRSPLAHIGAWHKAPYNFRGCLTPEKDFARLHTTSSNTCRLQKTTVGSLEDAWNNYMRGYHALQDNGAMIVEYENLVMDTDNTIKHVVEKLGGKVDVVRHYNEPAKSGGAPVGHEQALQKIQARAYMQKKPFDDEMTKANACAKLDQALMAKHKFLNNKYSDDCKA